MDQILDFLKGFNFQTIFSLGALMYYFNKHMEGTISSFQEKVEKQISAQSARIAEQSARTDKLYEMFVDLLKK